MYNIKVVDKCINRLLNTVRTIDEMIEYINKSDEFDDDKGSLIELLNNEKDEIKDLIVAFKKVRESSESKDTEG